MEKKVQCTRVLGFLFVGIICVLVETSYAQSSSYFINCGTNAAVDVDGRKWIGDLATGNNFTLTSPGISANTSEISGDLTFGQLYETSRIFTDGLNYTFKAETGSYILRLHFYPFSLKNLNVNESSFAVMANDMKLVSEFNVPGELSHKNLYLLNSGSNSSSLSLIKEYFIPINLDVLVIRFLPMEGSFGFINAIEIILVEDMLVEESVNRVGGSNTFLNLSSRGIETMYRLNVGGPDINPKQDSEFWRKWEVDTSYMLTVNAGSEISNSSNITYASANDSSVAPLLVYETARVMSNSQVLDKRFNMSWKFEVDPDFDYLVRLHFCELVYEKANERTFRIYINNKTAADNYDVFERAGGMNRAYYQDYFDVVSSKVSTLWVQLGPNTGAVSSVTDAFLNGMEIFKLSRNGNLAYVERFSYTENTAGDSNIRRLWVGIGAGIASSIILAVIVTLVFCFSKNRNKKSSDIKTSPNWWPLVLHGTVHDTANNKGSAIPGIQNPNGSMVSSRVGKHFALSEICAATNNFDESLVIGVGGFGKVYKGKIEDDSLVAIKRANPQSEQGLAEFETEIEMLSMLRHRHLVSLIGFCEERNEMILVYEYMANGTLRSHLFGSDLPPLTWKQRLEVCIGAARGLHYLHTGADRGIIHRDVKTTNILLDENFVAKMSDFGLSKTGPALDHTHVSTAVKGSFGYLDPEYFRRQQLTEKSDVYSFGVVLFEVLCARAVINPTLPRDQINLAEWAMRWQRQRSLQTIVDPHLKGNCSPDSLKKFGEIAEKCLADEGKLRPTMGEVLWHLEYVLQLHESYMRKTEAEEQENRSSNKVTGAGGSGTIEADEHDATDGVRDIP